MRTRQKVTPEHRNEILKLYAKGLSFKNIAQKTGWSVDTVRHICRGVDEQIKQKALETYYRNKCGNQAHAEANQDDDKAAGISSENRSQITIDYSMIYTAVTDALEQFFSSHSFSIQ